MNTRDKLFWIWLSEALGAANKDFYPLIELYRSPYDIFQAEDTELARVEGISEHTRQALSQKSLARATDILESCERLGVGILTYCDPRFPKILTEIKRPPSLLYYLGNLEELLTLPCVGMVGTRSMSAYGMDNAYRLSYELARSNAVIVSGMAAGIDGVCAAAAVKAGGKTMAVLGCGVDIVYPRHHQALREAILQNGAIVSEYPPGTSPKHYHFPVRNRLISGFSKVTVVVEAGVGSGSLITAKDAIQQGRAVFAVPANVGSRGAEGTNGLLRDGARVVTCARDILRSPALCYESALVPERLHKIGEEAKTDLSFLARMGVIELTRKPTAAMPQTPAAVAERECAPQEGRETSAPPKKQTEKSRSSPKPISPNPTPPQAKEPVSPTASEPVRTKTPDSVLNSLSAVQRAVLEMMPDDRPVTVDELNGLGHPYADIISAMTMLEILGLIQKLPGARYTKS